MDNVKPYTNVAESWPVYDTLCVCNTFYGTESVQQGWFNTFIAMSQREQHSFFKARTEGSIGLQYSNKQNQDTMDFAFEAYSLGVSFFAPGTRKLGNVTDGAFDLLDHGSAHWWEVEFPRHCAIQLKVQQDIVAELPCAFASPGYGPQANGASFEAGNGVWEDQVTPWMPAVVNMAVNMGVPSISNRWRFPKKIGIPRTATVEAILTISEQGRAALAALGNAGVGPYDYVLPETNDAGEGWKSIPARYGIQVSLIGKRMVQQRAQYHS